MNALEAALHGFVLILALLVVNWRASAPAIIHLEGGGWEAIAAGELLLALCLTGILLLLLHRADRLRGYLRAWRGNLLLAAFGLFALLSVLWSVSPVVSLNRWAVLALATSVGSYLCFQTRPRGTLEVLFWYGAVLAVLSAVAALLLPYHGRMLFPPYGGAWRGLFWHKNHLGTLMALLSTISLYRLEEASRVGRARMVLDGAVYVLQVALVLLSRSVTGLLVLVAGTGLSTLAYAWHRTRHRWHRGHYLASLVLAVGALGLAIVFSDQLFAMLGKESSLTGRLPMWQHVLSTYVARRPALGYGLGAFWNSAANREAIQQAVGWGYAVQIGDNGWLDVLLSLGGVGLGLFVLVQAAMLVRGLQRARLGREFLDTLPLVYFFAALIANMAFSLFFETESGVWLVLIALLFLPPSTEEEEPARDQSASGRA